MTYDFDKFPAIDRSNFVRYNQKFQKLVFGADNLLPFWVADTDFEVFPALSQALTERAALGYFPYETKSPQLKDELSNWYLRRYAIKINPRRLLFTPSVNTSIATIIDEFSRRGDGIIIQPPVYQAFAGIINGLERTIINNPLKIEEQRYKIDFEDLEKKAARKEAKIFLLCSPHNPVGRVWSAEELKKIAEICESNNVLMLTDEIHGDIIYPPNEYYGMLNVYEELSTNIIMVSSAGKSFGIPGLIDSFISTPNTEYYKLLRTRIENFHFDKSNGFANTAWEIIYKDGEKYLEQMLQYLKNNIDFLDDFISSNIPGVSFIPPEGTYQIWLNFNKLGLDNSELKNLLVQKAGLAMNEGHTYGPGGDGFMRMNIASPRKILEEAMGRLADTINKNS